MFLKILKIGYKGFWNRLVAFDIWEREIMDETDKGIKRNS